MASSERNDMVEYFGELLAGFAFTRNGWVQSYGSRCVKPPVIFGDVAPPGAHDGGLVDVCAVAHRPTPVKGMLTGPVTILQWSFVRDDQPRVSNVPPAGPGPARRGGRPGRRPAYA